MLALGYHAVSERWPASLSIAPQHLEEHVSMLADRGYRGVTFHEAVTGPTPKTLAITFDDAYRSVIKLALPILSGVGFVATVFAPTAYVGSEEPMAWPGIDHWRDTEHAEELVPMSWEELDRLAEAGWEIGSHSRTHPMLTQLDDEPLARELADSRRECEEGLGRPCRSVAYPYGDHDERVVRAAREAGYETGSSVYARHPPDPLRWPRIGVYHPDHEARFRLKVSPAMRRFRASRVFGYLNALRG